jgi:hypothetical protein
VLSGTALVVITLIIPLGVFMRYVMNAPLSWPEPASVVMMVMFSFLGGAAVYRANVHDRGRGARERRAASCSTHHADRHRRLHGGHRGSSCWSTARTCAR